MVHHRIGGGVIHRGREREEEEGEDSGLELGLGVGDKDMHESYGAGAAQSSEVEDWSAGWWLFCSGSWFTLL